MSSETAHPQQPASSTESDPGKNQPVVTRAEVNPPAKLVPKSEPAPAVSPPAFKVKPLAEPAHMKRRHWGLLASFVLLVVAPVVAVGFYLFVIAKDQYSSTVAFTVRQEEGNSASELLGGLANFAGTSVGTDSDILYEFIQSQEMARRVQAQLDLTTHYTQYWTEDPVYSIWPDATVEDLLWFWQRVVRISYDQSTSLIEVQVLAFDPDMAQQIAQAIVRESQAVINSLNEAARSDAMRYAEEYLDEAVARLKVARQEMTRFRTRTQIVDPEADIEGRMGVVNNLQQQLAEALIELDLLHDSTSSSDPRVTQAERRIDVIRDRIRKERANFAAGEDSLDPQGSDYPTLIAEYESLVVDREFAEETYTAALAAVDLARSEAQRQSRYLASYIQPTRAEEAEFPQRGMILGLTFMLALLSWSILVLIYYSIRDRR